MTATDPAPTALAQGTETGLTLLKQARPTNEAALREALDQAAKNPELVPLVRVVESLRAPA